MAEMEYLPGGIRERMEDLRNRRKLTLKEVAEKTGIDYSTLSRIENGNVKKVGDDVLLKLARFFGVSTDFLLGITPLPASRNKRYNTLDLASKIVCQRQASPSLLWKPPGYWQSPVHRRGNTLAASICFHSSAKRGVACLCIKQAVPGAFRECCLWIYLCNGIFCDIV